MNLDIKGWTTSKLLFFCKNSQAFKLSHQSKFWNPDFDLRLNFKVLAEVGILAWNWNYIYIIQIDPWVHENGIRIWIGRQIKHFYKTDQSISWKSIKMSKLGKVGRIRWNELQNVEVGWDSWNEIFLTISRNTLRHIYFKKLEIDKIYLFLNFRTKN